MFSLDMFGFRALWSPFYFLTLAAILVAYYLIGYKYYSRFNGEKTTGKQAAFFTIGIITLYIIKGSPLDLLGHIAFYAHMIQMAFLYLVIPPLFIFGIPHWVWRRVLQLPIMKPVFTFLTRPLIALIVFNGMFSFYHIPLVFDVIKTNMWYHAGYTSILFVFAIAMWWPLINELEEYETISGIIKVGYIFADGILITPACALIIFADSPMYATFSDPQAWAQAMELCVPAATLAGLNLSGPEMFTSLSLIDDQQLGGVLMKIIQEIVYLIFLAHTLFSWFRSEQKVDALPNAIEPRTAE
ncbi:cytochrome c oxidase assembly factor CtaG [Bacillus massilinigeriensis]|uniref:cytochrome c oxidase assembly factor CtaG n=1 Tax=Bacillus mediterraneensis TaxID=1805474 RepID=UPI0008F8C062|nr:cytochrome c oxidase assembly factor CtaG [Bacillus mediterraneensis]